MALKETLIKSHRAGFNQRFLNCYELAQQGSVLLLEAEG